MLPLIVLILLPSLVAGDLAADQKDAFCYFQCIPTYPPPAAVPKDCLRAVHNATVTKGNGEWAYDRLVFEGPDCGVYTFVVRTKSAVTMLPITAIVTKGFETEHAKAATADQAACLRKCGSRLLDATCTSPKIVSTRGKMINFGSGPMDVANPGQTVYRAVQFGCDTMTTIVRVYRSEFEMRATLEGDGKPPNSYIELWSINRGYLQTVPYHENVIQQLTDSQPEEKIPDKNVCALKCVGLSDPTSLAVRPECNRTLANATVVAKSGKWSYEREVYEGPECGVYTYLANTKAEITPTNTKSTSIVLNDNLAASTSCIRDCGIPMCAAPKDFYAVFTTDQEQRPVFHVAKFECDGFRTAIVRSFNPETTITINMEAALHTEQWTISNLQLLTTTMSC